MEKQSAEHMQPPAKSNATHHSRLDDMSEEERLASLRAFAEEKQYVKPGEDGTLPRGTMAMQSLVFGGGSFLTRGSAPYSPPTIAPPEHGAPEMVHGQQGIENAQEEASAAKQERKPSAFRKLVNKFHKES